MLRAHHITVTWGIDPVLEGVDLEIAEHDRLGVVGPNGSGKSTLLRVLAGDLSPHSGQVVRRPGLRVAWARQTPADPTASVAAVLEHAGAPVTGPYAALVTAQDGLARSGQSSGRGPELTAAMARLADAEERFLAAGGWIALARHDEVRSRLGVGTEAGIAPERSLGSLSGGERARVQLGCLLLEEPDLLLLDEPTNHLDLDGRRWLAAHLAGFPGAVVLASHDRAFLDRTVTRVVELDDLTADLEDYPGGGWTAYLAERERRARRLALDVEAQEKFRARIAERIAASKARAAAHEAANPRNPGARRVARMVARKAVVRERRLQRLMESAAWATPERRRDPLRIERPVLAGPARTVRLPGLAVCAGGRRLHTLDLTVGTHDRIWLTGPNGVGKSSLLAALQPHLPDAAVLTQVDDLDPRTWALDALRSAVPMYAADAEALLAAYGLDESDWTRPVGWLSVGQRARLRLAVVLHTPATMLVLDEPTNHLDLHTIEALEPALAAHPGGLLVVTHDERLADAIGLEIRWDLEAEGMSVGQSSPR